MYIITKTFYDIIYNMVCYFAENYFLRINHIVHLRKVKRDIVLHSPNINKLIIDTRTKFCIYARRAFRLQKTPQ